MTFAQDDPIRGPARGDAATAIAALDGPDAKDKEFVAALYQLAPLVGIDPCITVSQCFEETGGLTSVRWNRDLNPAGIGIPADDTPQPFPIGSATEAAKIYLACLNRLTAGTVAEPWAGEINPQARQWLGSVWERHCQAVAIAGISVRTIADLCTHYPDAKGEPQSTWAWDTAYATKIAQWGQRVFGALPNAGATPVVTTTAAPPAAKLNMAKDLIPLPPCTGRLIPDRDTGAWDDLGQRTIKGITLHRMQGTLWGTDGWFRRGAGVSDGLTDFGIDNTTGELLQWNDPSGAAHTVRIDGQGNYVASGGTAYQVSANRAGWASGPVKAPYGDGAAFVTKYGVNAVNRDRVSIEIGGWFAQPGETSREDPVAAVCWELLAQFCAHFAHNAGIAWSDYPIVPADGFSFICWHQEFTIGTGKVCPGKTVMDGTNALIARTKAIMRAAQTSGTPTATTTAAPKPPASKWAPKHPVTGTKDFVENEHGYIRWAKTLTVGKDGVTPREYATPTAKPTGPDLKPGAKSDVAWICRGDDGELYVIGTGASRMLASRFVEFGAIKAAATT